jgi:hypothetical protein
MIEYIAATSLLITIFGVPTIYYKLGKVETELKTLPCKTNSCSQRFRFRKK